MIVFATRQWSGSYGSRDIPQGVETAPYTSAVFLVSVDGTTPPRRVIDVQGKGEFPAYSPDGEWIYFQAAPAGSAAHLFRCHEDGSALQNLTVAHAPPGDRYGFKLSRDGTCLLFTYHDGRIGRVVMAHADGSEPALVAPDIGYHYMADISPDNRLVVFSHTARGYVLTLKDRSSGALRVLTPDHPECFCPQFTPDGQTLIFMRRDGDIYRVGVDGTGFERLTQGNDYHTFFLSPGDRHGSSDYPSLSPDGRQIAYIARKDGIPQVHVMTVDGTHPRPVTSRKTPCGRATFGADGHHLAFVSWEGSYPQLFVVSLDGGEPTQRTDGPGAVYTLNEKPRH